MSFNADVKNVMIASPNDVTQEPQIICEVIHEWNAINAQIRQLVLLPSRWETHASPLMGDRPQGIINKQLLENCDLLVAVFWTRLGSPTGEASSGTVEEINKHCLAGKPTMIYFSNAPVRPDLIDNNQHRALGEFRTQCEPLGLVWSYSSLDEFRRIFTRQLSQTVDREFKDSVAVSEENIYENAQQLEAQPLSSEEQTILIECSQDRNGLVLCIHVRGGMILQSNGKKLDQTVDPRSQAKWKAALDNLLVMGLLEKGNKDEVFSITHAGYEVADRLRKPIATAE